MPRTRGLTHTYRAQQLLEEELERKKRQEEEQQAAQARGFDARITQTESIAPRATAPRAEVPRTRPSASEQLRTMAGLDSIRDTAQPMQSQPMSEVLMPQSTPAPQTPVRREVEQPPLTSMVPESRIDPARVTPTTDVEPATEGMNPIEYGFKWIGSELQRGLWSVNEGMYRVLKTTYEYAGNPIGYYGKIGMNIANWVSGKEEEKPTIAKPLRTAPKWLDEQIEKYGKPEVSAPLVEEMSAQEARVREKAYENSFALGLATDMANMGSRVLLMLIQMGLLNKVGAASTATRIAPGTIPAPATPSVTRLQGWPKAIYDKVQSGIRATAQTSPQQYQQTMSRMQRMAGHALATTPGGLEDRIESAAYRVAYNLTPTVANATGATGLTAIGTDVLLNSFLTSPSYMKAYDEAGGLTPEFWAFAVPQMTMDVFMARGTRGLAASQGQARYNQQLDKYAKEFDITREEAQERITFAQRVMDLAERAEGTKVWEFLAEERGSIGPREPSDKQPWEMTVKELASQERDFYSGKQHLIPLDKFIEIPIEKNFLERDGNYYHILANGSVGSKVNEKELSSLRNQAKESHKYYIEAALKEGKSIPPSVLKDYPDLERLATARRQTPSLAPESRSEATRLDERGISAQREAGEPISPETIMREVAQRGGISGKKKGVPEALQSNEGLPFKEMAQKLGLTEKQLLEGLDGKPVDLSPPKMDINVYKERIKGLTLNQLQEERINLESRYPNAKELQKSLDIELAKKFSERLKSYDDKKLQDRIRFLESMRTDETNRTRFPNYEQLIKVVKAELGRRANERPTESIDRYTRSLRDMSMQDIRKAKEYFEAKVASDERQPFHEDNLKKIEVELARRESEPYRKSQTVMHSVASSMGLSRDDRVNMARDFFNRPNLKSTTELTAKELELFTGHLRQQQAEFGAMAIKEEFPNTAKKHGKTIDRNKAKVGELIEDKPISRREQRRAEMAQELINRAEDKLKKIEEGIDRPDELGYERVSAYDVAKAHGLPTSEAMKHDLVGYLWKNPLNPEITKFIMKDVGITKDEMATIMKDPNIFERAFVALWRGLPEEMRSNLMTARVQIADVRDGYGQVIDNALKGLGDKALVRVAAMLEGKMEMSGREGEAAKILRDQFFNPLFDQAVGAGIMKKEQYVSNYFSRIQDKLGEVKDIGDEIRVPRAWMVYERTGDMKDYNRNVRDVANMYLNAISKNIYMKPVLERWEPIIDEMPPHRNAMAKQMFQAAMSIPNAETQMWNNTLRDIYETFNRYDPENAPQHMQEASRMLVSVMAQKHMGFSPGTAMRNTTQPLLAIADVAKKGAPFRGLGYYTAYRKIALTKEGRDFVNTYCTILQDRTYMDGIKRASEYQWKINKKLGNISKATMSMFKAADLDNVKASFYIGYRAALADGKSQAEAIRHGNNVALRTQYDYSIGRAAIYHSPAGRLASIFTSWSSNYLSLMGDWMTSDMKSRTLLGMALAGAGAYLYRKLGFKMNIGPIEVLGGLPYFRFFEGDTAVLGSMKEEWEQIAKHLISGDPDEWKKAAEEIVYQLPGGVAYKRIATVGRALMNEGRVVDDKGRVRYTITTPGMAIRMLMGMGIEAANRWDLVYYKTDWQDEPGLISEIAWGQYTNHKAYENVLHKQINPNARLDMQSIWFALRGQGYEVEDIFRSPEEQLRVMEERVIASGLDPEEARKTAMANIRTSYSSHASIAVEKGKDDWQTEFREAMEFLEKAEGDLPRYRRRYYDLLEMAITDGNREVQQRAIWALKYLGADDALIQRTMENRGAGSVNTTSVNAPSGVTRSTETPTRQGIDPQKANEILERLAQ